jgi:hypothetical protein
VLADGKTPNPEYSPTTQIGGYQSKADGMVYIAADSFDRSQGVSMYRVDPEHVTDREAWQPWTGDGWGSHGQQAAPLTEPGTRFGEMSFREIDVAPCPALPGPARPDPEFVVSAYPVEGGQTFAGHRTVR